MQLACASIQLMQPVADDQGVRTLVGTSVTLNLKDAQQRQEGYNETWFAFPDDEPVSF